MTGRLRWSGSSGRPWPRPARRVTRKRPFRGPLGPRGQGAPGAAALLAVLDPDGLDQLLVRAARLAVELLQEGGGDRVELALDRVFGPAFGVLQQGQEQQGDGRAVTSPVRAPTG
ncbi:hypothetical protein GCM10010343_25360 [Streptomyces avidinii]|nr:hypothetical protein GCM10010343_25360 [Streptomyces avidinii]